MPSFTINCPVEKWPQARAYFLKSAPNQTEDSDTPLSDDDWIKHKILLMVKGQVVKGMRMEQEEQAQKPVDDAFTIS